jgi:hypothetical protein
MVPSLGAAATAGLRAKLKALWDHWTQGWFPTAVRNGYLRNIDGRSALATAVIVPGGLRQVGDFWHERVERCWVCYVYLPGRPCRHGAALTPITAAEAAYHLLSQQ